MASKSMVMASSFTAEAFEQIDVNVSDSESWEIVEPSDSDSDDGNFSYSDVTSDDDDDEVVPDVDDLLQYGSPASDISLQSLVDEITHHCEELKDAYEIDDRRQVRSDDVVLKDDRLIAGAYDPTHEEDADESDEESKDDNHDDLDDELVPRWLNNKFERQRMRKLGKRAYPKMKKSKRIVNQYNKPGCVGGKHGLGLKHNLIW